MLILLEPFLLATLASVIAVPLLARLAMRLGIIDHPDAGEHKTHKVPIPYLGGIAFHLAFTVVLADTIWRQDGRLISEYWYSDLIVLYLAATAMLVVGLADDVYGFHATNKLILQIIVIAALVFSGFGIEHVTNPFTGQSIELGWIGDLLAILWILAIVNAMNLIDGLDGLAAGVAASASAAAILIALSPWNGFTVLIGIALLSGTLGFLPYNLPPARIYMGDAGSLYLGFLLAASSIAGTSKGTTLLTLTIPIVALLVPVVDTGLAVLRRTRRGRDMFRGDRQHLHHRLLNLGLTPAQTTWTLVGLAALCSVAAVIASRLTPRVLALSLLTLAAALIWGLWFFGVLEERNGNGDSENPVSKKVTIQNPNSAVNPKEN